MLTCSDLGVNGKLIGDVIAQREVCGRWKLSQEIADEAARLRPDDDLTNVLLAPTSPLALLLRYTGLRGEECGNSC